MNLNPAGYYYNAFGLRIYSTLAIAEFPFAKPQPSTDVIIWCEPASAPSSALAGKNHFFDVQKTSAFLYFSGVGQFRIKHGKEIVIIPDKQATARTLALYLSGVVFAVLLYLRGLLVFHGASLAINATEAIAFVGDSGAGKSTLAAALHSRGYTCLADDVVPLNVGKESVTVQPAFPLLKVMPIVAEMLGIDDKDLLEVDQEEEKRYMVQPHKDLQSSYRLKTVFFIAAGNSISIEPMSARQFMMESIRFTMPTRLLQQTGEQRHFMQCAAVAGTVPGFTLTRNSNLSTINTIVNAVENVIAEYS